MQQRALVLHTPGFNKELDRFYGVPGNEPMPSGGSPFTGIGNLSANGNRWLDFGLVETVTRIKTVVVDFLGVTSAGAQQATAQLFVSRSIFATGGSDPQPNVAGVQASSPFTPVASAAASQFPTNPVTNLNACQARGAAPVNVGPSSAGPINGRFFLTPQDIPDLQWDFPVVGIEITAPAAFTGGSVTVYLELASI